MRGFNNEVLIVMYTFYIKPCKIVVNAHFEICNNNEFSGELEDYPHVTEIQ